MGLPLLEQIGKKIILTDAGEQLYATCADWLETRGRFEQTIADLKDCKQGRLRVAAVTTTKYFVLRRPGPFCAQYKSMTAELQLFV